MEQVTLRVSGMHCDGCESRVEKALGRLDGVRRASADHSSGEVRVAFEPARTSAQELRDCIERAGYAVGGEAGASG